MCKLKDNILAVFLLIAVSGCSKPAQELLLRFAPQVGRTYKYTFSINLDKTTYGRLGNEKGSWIFSMHVLGKEGNAYHTKWDIELIDSNLSEDVMDMMRDRPGEFLKQNISDRYIFSSAGEMNLCFPEEPVGVGECWDGKCLFNFGDLMTLKPPMIKVAYRLVGIDKAKDGTYCHIECTPVEKVIEVPFQMGQLGLRCDAEGLVTAVSDSSDARGRIEIGDKLLAINGKRASTKRERSILAERFIEPLRDIGEEVQLTVVREGREHDVAVKKTFVTMGAMRVETKEALRKILFNQSCGILISETADDEFSVTYHFPDDLPFVDNYTGRPFVKEDVKTEIPPRIYDYTLKMSLLQE